MAFVEFKQRTYWRGGYLSENMLVAVDDISIVIRCTDDRDLTNIVTKDGKVRTLSERYEEVVKKIRDAEQREG